MKSYYQLCCVELPLINQSLTFLLFPIEPPPDSSRFVGQVHVSVIHIGHDCIVFALLSSSLHHVSLLVWLVPPHVAGPCLHHYSGFPFLCLLPHSMCGTGPYLELLELMLGGMDGGMRSFPCGMQQPHTRPPAQET